MPEVLCLMTHLGVSPKKTRGQLILVVLGLRWRFMGLGGLLTVRGTLCRRILLLGAHVLGPVFFISSQMTADQIGRRHCQQVVLW